MSRQSAKPTPPNRGRGREGRYEKSKSKQHGLQFPIGHSIATTKHNRRRRPGRQFPRSGMQRRMGIVRGRRQLR